MSLMRNTIAVVCSDIHLSMKPPAARANEPNWFQAMERTLSLLRGIVDHYSVPLLCAGDIFDKWNSPAELTNFALRYLPKMFAIPGQHDIPFHNLNHMDKSAYTTLVEADVVTDIKPGRLFHPSPNLTVMGFPWGVPFTELPKNYHRKSTVPVIALCHRYVWVNGKNYPGAPPSGALTNKKLKKDLVPFDIAIFGDNHQGFHRGYAIYDKQGTAIFNCGTLMRRDSNEKEYRPRIGLIQKDGVVVPIYMDLAGETFHTVEVKPEAAVDMIFDKFLHELSELQDIDLDFGEMMTRALDKAEPSALVRQIIMEAMEGGK